MPRVEQFPYEISEAEEKRIADTPKQLGNDDKPLHSIMFQQVEVTIERSWTGGNSVGFSFEEDVPMDNGYKIIWNMKSEWDEQANKPKAYKAKDGQEGTPSDALTWVEGDKVKVALSRRDYWHKTKQESTIFTHKSRRAKHARTLNQASDRTVGHLKFQQLDTLQYVI